ncbi:hypothetical protein V5F29_07930 [Xanthobacter aminoxidans]|uniref:hypothetical protein n=1 Tax=Xanthobacter aminoxidans TaxID=186280 RepID=UPI00372938B1
MSAMHRQNRVTPLGMFEAVPARGLFMGNRGNLRRRDGTQKIWHARGWVCCVTSFRGRRIDLDDPRRYTPLFFMDEAVALAAGHRPCGECRHADYQAFKQAWRRAFTLADDAPLTAGDMDKALHAARIARSRQTTFRAASRDMPAGTFVALDDRPGEAFLIDQSELYRWSHAGYGPPVPMPGTDATVLTPRPTLAVLRAGYAPRLAARG